MPMDRSTLILGPGSTSFRIDQVIITMNTMLHTKAPVKIWTLAYLSSLTVTTPSSRGMITAMLTSSLKPSNLLINTGFLVFPCLFCDGLISAAILLSSRDNQILFLEMVNINMNTHQLRIQSRNISVDTFTLTLSDFSNLYYFFLISDRNCLENLIRVIIITLVQQNFNTILMKFRYLLDLLLERKAV